MTTHDPFAWLNYEEPEQLQTSKPQPAQELQPAVSEAAETRRELVLALRQLDGDQRVFLEELVEESFDVKRAIKATRARGFQCSRQRLERKWMHQPEFSRALDRLKDYGALSIGISKTALLARLLKLADDCRALVTVLDKNDNAITRPVDAQAARHTLETIAKISGVLRDEQRDARQTLPAFVVGIQVSTPNPEAVGVTIDGKATRLP